MHDVGRASAAARGSLLEPRGISLRRAPAGEPAGADVDHGLGVEVQQEMLPCGTRTSRPQAVSDLSYGDEDYASGIVYAVVTQVRMIFLI